MAGILNLAVVAVTAILSIRLFTSGLYRRYRAFFFYLVFATLREGILGLLNPARGLYFHIWVLTEPLEWLFMALLVLELYSLVLQDYRGLSTAGRWALIAAVAVALAASALSLLLPSHSTAQGPLMAFYYVAERAVYFSLVVFLITILGFLLQYPITLSRNIIVHSFLFSVYFLGTFVFYLLLSTSRFAPSLIEVITIAMDLLTLSMLGAWIATLTPAGELRKLRLRPTWMPGKEEELASQLNNLNAALLRAVRK